MYESKIAFDRNYEAVFNEIIYMYMGTGGLQWIDKYTLLVGRW